jgi:hypothetical protein
MLGWVLGTLHGRKTLNVNVTLKGKKAALPGSDFPDCF